MELDVDYIFGEPEQYRCRVCLSSELKLYRLLGCGVQNDFHNITGLRISSDDGLPQYICCVCRELLMKAVAFRNKAISTQNIWSLRQVTIGSDQNIVTTPLISFIQTDTLLISIPPVAPTDEVDVTNLADDILVKQEYVQNSEHKDKLNDTKTFVKAEANEHSFDDGTDYEIDVDVTSILNNTSDKKKVVKEVDVKKILDEKPKTRPKAKTVKNRKFPNLHKGEPEMDDQTVKEYLLRTNKGNFYCEMLHTYIISKYIDETKECNTKINKANDYELDSEDESIPLNKLIKLEDDSEEIDNILTLQTDMEHSKKILYEFIKERYMEKKKPPKKRAKDLVRIKFKRDMRVVHSQMAMEELRKKYNLDIKILSLEEQIADIKDRAKTQKYKNSLYKCEECFRGFQFENTYSYHMRSHDPAISGNVKCEVCKRLFAKRRQLLKHALSHKHRYICNECGRVCKNHSVAKEHAKSHFEKNSFKCEYCFRLFSKSASRTNHIRIKHGSVECELCYDLMAPAGLTMHNILRHKETFKCRYCNKVFNDADALDVHTSNSIDGGAVCNPNERPCAVCGESFVSESEWLPHIQEHRKNRKQMELVKKAMHRQSLNPEGQRRRSRSNNNGALEPERSVMCEMCGDTFISQAAMRYHQRIHTGEKPFACTFCPKRFRLKTLLTMHVNTHTGDRPHKCKKCPKSFRSQTALYRHQLVHTKERRHRCTLCEKSFQTSSCVKLHIKTVHLKIPMPPRVRNRKKRTE